MPGFVFILVTYHFHTRCLTSLVARLTLIVRMRGSSREAIVGFSRKIEADSDWSVIVCHKCLKSNAHLIGSFLRRCTISTDMIKAWELVQLHPLILRCSLCQIPFWELYCCCLLIWMHISKWMCLNLKAKQVLGQAAFRQRSRAHFTPRIWGSGDHWGPTLQVNLARGRKYVKVCPLLRCKYLELFSVQ